MKDDNNLQDTSDYGKINIYNLHVVIQKVIGKRKDEIKGDIMTDYVGLKLKNCRRKQFNSPPDSKTKTIAEEKQLNSATGTKQLNSTGENNSAQQQEDTTQLGSRNETTRLCAACNRLHRLQPPLQ
ncbi:hypothetical protein TNCV_2982571 [Trichonephila clavipes]|nr:hypothetical protein TNCV_2982571 [Trichonephila clavipes]